MFAATSRGQEFSGEAANLRPLKGAGIPTLNDPSSYLPALPWIEPQYDLHISIDIIYNFMKAGRDITIRIPDYLNSKAV